MPAKAGSDIKLTLDLKIQQACETALASAIELAKTTGYSNAGNGAVVCLDPNNGEILGMASEPSFDPSVFIGGVSNDVWTELNDDKGSHPLLNRAISGHTCRPRPSSRFRHWPVFSLEPTLQHRQPTARAIGRAWARLGASAAG